MPQLTPLVKTNTPQHWSVKLIIQLYLHRQWQHSVSHGRQCFIDGIPRWQVLVPFWFTVIVKWICNINVGDNQYVTFWWVAHGSNGNELPVLSCQLTPSFYAEYICIVMEILLWCVLNLLAYFAHLSVVILNLGGTLNVYVHILAFLAAQRHLW